ncbi:UNVERIFIED_CONTAM: hypothetical protein Sradi_2338100 [Sesamum radiatum]|uniref:Reverse transcriptase RNase H-like domain-containing protein n=1 Tax=Sesamum radiatum TaxID=300843 RepID=A0AAW2T716_SESRA
MGLKNSEFSPVKTPLVGFGGSEVASIGTIDLPVSMGEEPRRRTAMERLCAIRKTRKCYNLSLQKGQPQVRTKRKGEGEIEKEDPKRMKAERIELVEEYRSAELVAGQPDKTTRIGSDMSKSLETLMIEFLKKSVDLLAWSPSDFKGIDPEVIVHRLNVDPLADRDKERERRSWKGSEVNRGVIEGIWTMLWKQESEVIVLTNHPLGHIMTRPDASSRLVKWAVELGEYDVEYQSRTTIKAQVLADFVVEFAGEQVQEEKGGWLLHVDGSSNANNGGVDILLQGPNGVEIEVTTRFPVGGHVDRRDVRDKEANNDAISGQDEGTNGMLQQVYRTANPQK